MMNSSDTDALQRLKDGAAKLEVNLSSEQLQLFSGYLDLLHRWHRLFNLTAVSPDKWIAKHLLDSLSAYQFIPQVSNSSTSNSGTSKSNANNSRASNASTSNASANNINNCIDIGSGAGLPGIPLAIAMPTTQWFLLEKHTKKCGFLLRVKLELGLNNLHVINASAEKLAALLQDIREYESNEGRGDDDNNGNHKGDGGDHGNAKGNNKHNTKIDSSPIAIEAKLASRIKQVAYGSQLPTEFSLAIGRSVFSEGLLDYCEPLVATGGVAIDMHGQYSGQPKNTSKWQVEKFSKVRVPYLPASRHIICWRKID